MSNDEGVDVLTRDAEGAQKLEDDDLLYLGAMNFTTASTGGNLADENWERYDELTVPILAIHGTADEATSPAGSEELIEDASSTDKTLELVDGAKHSLLDDSDAESVMSTMLRWLERHTE